MSTFTLAISCLTTSNLPWFTDLTFQVPMQYCSLQHRTLLLSPVISWYCFCLGFIPSFFLESFLHWSPVAFWALLTWRVHLSASYLFAFSYCSWGSQGKNVEVFAIPFPSGPCFVRTLLWWLCLQGLIPGSGRSPGEGNGNPLQYSCLENSTDGGAWCHMGSQRVRYDWATSLHFHHDPSVLGGPTQHGS